MNSKNLLKITVLAIFCFYIILVFASDVEKIQAAFFTAQWLFLVPILGILSMTIFFRSLIQKILLKQIDVEISITNSFFLYLAGLSMLITPGGSGLLIKSHFLKKKFDTPISKTAPIIITERLFDLFGIIIFLIFTLTFFHSQEFLVLVTVSLTLFLMAMLIFKIEKFSKIFFFFAKKLKLEKQGISNQLEFNISFQRIFTKKLLVLLGASFTSMIFIDAFVIYLGFLTFNIDFGYVESSQIYYISILLGILSLLPGGVGVTEGGMIGLITQKEIDMGTATAIVIFIRLFTLWIFTFVGLCLSVLINQKNFKRQE